MIVHDQFQKGPLRPEWRVSQILKQASLLIFRELRGCVKVEVAVLGTPSLIVVMVSVDVKQR